MIIPLDPMARRIVVSMTLIALFAFAMVFVTMALTRQQDARQQVQITRATGKALDRVAEKTPIIRQEQKAKENEVAAIEVLTLGFLMATAQLLNGCAANVINIPDSLRRSCESTVGDMSKATELKHLSNAIVAGDADLRVCDARREAVVTIAEAGKRPWWVRLMPG